MFSSISEMHSLFNNLNSVSTIKFTISLVPNMAHQELPFIIPLIKIPGCYSTVSGTFLITRYVIKCANNFTGRLQLLTIHMQYCNAQKERHGVTDS